jgi:acetyl esterase/lipase
MKPAVALLFVSLLACGQNTNSPANQPQLPPGISVEANLAYAEHPQTVLDVYAPKDARPQDRPAVILIHGGGWVGGSREQMTGYVVPWLTRGFVVANIGYRLAGVAPAPAAVEDVIAAARWFRDNAKRWNVNKDQIVVTGNSAGGHLALMVGLASKAARMGKPVKVAAVVNFYGITDVEDQLAGPNQRTYALQWIPDGLDRTELARRVSPLLYVRRDAPPVLTIHGSADEVVPYDHGVRLTRALRDAGADAELIPVPNGGHGFSNDVMTDIFDRVFRWLERRGIAGQSS